MGSAVGLACASCAGTIVLAHQAIACPSCTWRAHLGCHAATATYRAAARHACPACGAAISEVAAANETARDGSRGSVIVLSALLTWTMIAIAMAATGTVSMVQELTTHADTHWVRLGASVVAVVFGVTNALLGAYVLRTPLDALRLTDREPRCSREPA